MDIYHDLEQRVNQFIQNNWMQYKNSIQIHDAIRDYLNAIAYEYNFISQKEYKVLNYKADRNGYIDLAWEKYPNKLVIIEIDSSPRQKSILKLMKVNATERIWICSKPEESGRLIDEFGASGAIKIIPIINYRRLIKGRSRVL